MKVLVLGGGVVGVTSAYCLSRAGHEVTLVDRQSGPGEETSFANGGQISAGLAEPWANPEVPRQLLRWLGRKNPPLALRLRAGADFWGWALRFLENCATRPSARNLERALQIALYSREQLRNIRATTGISYDMQTDGILKIYRHGRAFNRTRQRLETMNALGANLRALDIDACLALEPSLTPIAEELAGAIYSPDDESGDAHQFTVKLTEAARRLGAVFKFGHSVEKLVSQGDRIERVITDRESLTTDVVVVSLGSYSPLLLRPLGINLPICPTKGHSITLPIRNGAGNRAPSRSITDESKKLVFSRFGDRLRVAGTAIFTGYDPTIEPEPCAAMAKELEAIFPGTVDQSKPTYWAGLRPLTPDTLPIIGPTPFSNLFLNTGHGTYGWTMAAGSGQILADLIAGQKPQIETGPFAMDRF
ncbi:MAG: amino acid dehydrogenase [Rhodospirillaceae bacterium]|nr:MAG: amino acid dehydrogenase [Rhodospirillaceae bacterium]